MRSELFDIFPEVEVAEQVAAACRSCVIDRNCVVFCMTARVGSTALTQILSNRCGFPFIEEIFNGRNVANEYAKNQNIKTLQGYLKFLNSFHAAPLFSFKTNWVDFAWLSNSYKILFPRLHFIYLDRLDVEAQAVSLYTAIKTGVWHSLQGESPPQAETLSLEKSTLDRIVWELSEEKQLWWDFFNREGICPTTIMYEGTKGSPRSALQRILRDLNIEACAFPSNASTQPTTTSEQMILLRNYRLLRYPGVLGL